MEGKFYTITVKGQDEESITITTSNESGLEEWKNIFTTILIFLTWDPETIKELFAEEE